MGASEQPPLPQQSQNQSKVMRCALTLVLTPPAERDEERLVFFLVSYRSLRLPWADHRCL